MPHPSDVVRFADTPAPPGASAWIAGAELYEGEIEIAPYDPAWPRLYRDLEATIRGALGDRVLAIEHVGSTSVPGLAAKPVIDIDLTVADSVDEASYVPPLERAGFSLRIREPWWHEHRMLRSNVPRCNLHVWSPGVPEVVRHTLFRDWLRTHPEDAERYQEAKRAAAALANARHESGMQYNARKEAVLREICVRAFRAAGLVD